MKNSNNLWSLSVQETPCYDFGYATLHLGKMNGAETKLSIICHIVYSRRTTVYV